MIRNLVFEGGGVKGIAYGGALTALDDLGILSGVQRVAGTSAGAITAVLLAVGYSSKELSEIVAKTNFNDFADDTIGLARDAIRLLSEYGWHRGNFFTEWIGSLIEQKTGKKDLTFAELKAQENTMDLYLTATNLSKQQVQIFSFEHTPDVQIKNAARMSMGIPLYFQCIRYRGDIMVDGGVSYNYPIDIFDHDQYLHDSDNWDKCNQETLGLRADSGVEIDFNQSWQNSPTEIEDLFGFTSALIGFLNSVANKKHLEAYDLDRTIFIDSMDINATDFDLLQEQINTLIANGKKAVESFFEKVTPAGA